jgi:uncharacterized protein (DUF427 family)
VSTQPTVTTGYRAVWHNAVLAESHGTVVVEGNQYFPLEDVKSEFLQTSESHTVCGWKGIASYYDVIVDGNVNHDAAWYYPDPSEAAKQIRGRVAFWHGVKVEPV